VVIYSSAVILSHHIENNGGHGYGFIKMMDSSPGEVVRKARAHPLVSLLEDAAGENDLVHEGPYKRYVHLDFC